STGINFEDFTLIDTAGLNEADGGEVPAGDAVAALVQLLKRIQDGVALLVFVKQRGRILKQDKDNYDMFVKEMVESKVPVVAIITGCEGSDMQRWPLENQAEFTAEGMDFKAV